MLFAVGVMAFCFAGLGLGLLLSQKVRLKGSCGRESSKNPDLACPACGGKPSDCPNTKD